MLQIVRRPSPVAATRPLNARIWERDPHDYYTEERWCSSRLFEDVLFEGSIYDPACGSGRIVHSARVAGYKAYGSDIIRRSPLCHEIFDFRDPWPRGRPRPQNIVCNPPFTIAELFVDLALERCRHKVAMLLPHAWLTGDEHSRWLEYKPLRQVLVMTPRPSMPPGRVIEAGHKAEGGKQDFDWFIFEPGYHGVAEVGWLRRNP
ncbi:conserved hypothetical protein [Methylocella tundrae]|uniref:Methyltransferase n=1 Tax=Methylocella tundrae TaxID=227605 RepID=A0A8B6M3N6_METTU|nr:hypothetical protein [Methylocella tundrae]VTZ48742.1 conserved hypothetical protein [Methylocella tundrae]